MLSFFSPLGGAAKKPTPSSTDRREEPVVTPAVPKPAARRAEEQPLGSEPPQKKLYFRTPPSGEKSVAKVTNAGDRAESAVAGLQDAEKTALASDDCSLTEPVAAISADLGSTRPNKRRSAKPVSYAGADIDSDEDDDEEEAVSLKPTAKRARKSKVVFDSESEDEYVPDDEEKAAAKAELKREAAEDEGAASSDAMSDIEKDEVPRRPVKNATTTVARRPVAARPTTPSPQAKQSGKQSTELRYEWLRDIRDANGVRPGEPDYDPSTLLMPRKPWTRVVNGKTKPITDFEKQYWEIKSKFWDTVVFFKKGKFYELYEKDADIGNKELDLKLTDRVNMKMVGVPEKSFPAWAAKLLGQGYKIAKVDEKESMLAKGMREKKEKKAGKVVKETKIIKRELSAVFTQGTLSGEFLVGDESRYIMAIKEMPDLRFGICFADVGTAEINLCSFEDDLALTHLETLLVQIQPKELVLPKGGLQPLTLRLLKLHASKADFTWLKPDFEFWDAEKTIDEMERDRYFAADGVDAPSTWPPELAKCKETPEIMSALGGLVAYFRTLLLDKKVISQGRFQIYDPLQHGGTLLLDGQTLQNLEILSNGVDGGTAGTVYELLCHCNSGFGKRLFRKWLCHPLRGASDIEQRFVSVAELSENYELKETLKSLLKSLPDLERCISQIHVGSCKTQLFLDTLDAFDKVQKTFDEELKPLAGTVSSAGLLRLLSSGDGGAFPDLKEELEYFSRAFDRGLARSEDTVVPAPGTVAEYDANADEIAGIEKQLDKFIRQHRAELQLGRLEYYHPGVSKEQYQIPVPTKALKLVPDSWSFLSEVKGVKRYWSPQVRDLQEPLAMAKESRRQLLRDSLSSFLGQFDEHVEKWTAAVECLAQLDCLLSLALAKDVMGEPMCKPTLVTDGTPCLRVSKLRHPCIEHTGAVRDYIPNDTSLGGDGATAIVLTGPNMGGKSTLLRQTCVATLMAQLGAYVPAEEMELSPVDRIFTRIGANDNIIAGRSTFMVELKETATILNHATRNSLVILDELGRGTATFDGTAIAFATLQHLLDSIKCRTMFATHYHSLTDDLKGHPLVSLQHMACHVEANRRDVTFLYTLTPGVCSKSYGLNVANMAGLPESIVARAEAKAAELFELTGEAGRPRRRALHRLITLLGDGESPLPAATAATAGAEAARLVELLCSAN